MSKAYDYFLESLSLSSQDFTIRKSDKFKIIPGWNLHCRELHNHAREAYLTWHSNGKVRSGIYYDNMISTRAAFRKALNKCKSEEAEIQNALLTDSFA